MRRLTSETLGVIERNGGSMELAGASAWQCEWRQCTSGNVIMAFLLHRTQDCNCTYDDAIEERKRIDRLMTAEEREKKGGGGGDVEDHRRAFGC